VATYRSGDSWAKETFMYHPAGARGPGFTGGLLLRDREGTLTNPVLWAKDAASGTLDERVYACGDFKGNVSALVSETGTLVDTFRYSATGVPLGIPLGDVNGDGKVDGASGAADYVKTNAAIGGGAGAYLVELDVNLDGLVTTADRTIVTANDGVQTGRGKLSAASVGWRVGWGEMEWNANLQKLMRRGKLIHTETRIVGDVVGGVGATFEDERERGPRCVDKSGTLQDCLNCCTGYDETDLDCANACFAAPWNGEDCNHLRIKYIKINGLPASHCYAEFGAPSNDRKRRICSAGAPRGMFGCIRGSCGPFFGSPDEGIQRDSDGGPLEERTTRICCPASTAWVPVDECIANAMRQVERCCILYNPFGPNSNTVLRAVLESCLPSGCRIGVPNHRFGAPAIGWEAEEALRSVRDCLQRAST